jgi:predicted dehydrogenase
MGSGSAGRLYLRQSGRGCSLRYVACADVEPSRAAALAREHGVPRACSPDELLADPDVEVVVNLTPATEHGRVGRRVLRAGKHLYAEKPLAPDVRQGRALLALAARRRLRVACAPDTFLGPALQTARELVDAGAIGVPFAASASVAMPAPSTWHPRPAPFYGPAAGPLFDMGPYYLTALVSLLGPVARVAGMAVVAPHERRSLVTGELIEPAVPTHELGLLEFAGGMVATLAISFDAPASAAPPLELHGTLGSLRLPDPNAGEGAVAARLRGEPGWTDVPAGAAGGRSRCAGVEDMAAAIRKDRPHRASGELALHVLDAMESLRRSAATGRMLRLRTTCERPAPLRAAKPAEGPAD